MQGSIKGRPYFSLQAGREKGERVAISLGYVTQEQAERALLTILDEEAKLGTRSYDRVFRLRDDPENGGIAKVRDYLIGDIAVDEVFGPKNPGDFPLSSYVYRVWEPYRKASRPRTWRTESHDWVRMLRSNDFAGLLPREVDARHVDRLLRSQRRSDGTPMAPSSLRKMRVAVAALLKHAYREGHRNTPPPAYFEIDARGAENKGLGKQEPLTLDEVRSILSVATGSTRGIIAVGVGLGLRPNEATRMRWEDIDWETHTLFVRGTKTDLSADTVPLLPIAYDGLRRWWDECGQPKTGTVWVKLKGGKAGVNHYAQDASGYTPWTKALRTAVQAAGITRRVTPYTLRHTAATLLVEQGIPYTSIAKLLRHSNPRMLEQRYDHSRATKAPGLRDLAPTL